MQCSTSSVTGQDVDAGINPVLKPVSNQIESLAQIRPGQPSKFNNSYPIRHKCMSREILVPTSGNIDGQSKKRSYGMCFLNGEKPSIRLIGSTESDPTKANIEAMRQERTEPQQSSYSLGHSQVPSLSYSSASSAPSTPNSHLTMSPGSRSQHSRKQYPTSEHLNRSHHVNGFANSPAIMSTSQVLQQNITIQSLDASPDIHNTYESISPSVELPTPVFEGEKSFMDWDDKPSRIARVKQSIFELRRAASPIPKNDCKPLPPTPTTPCTQISFPEAASLSSPPASYRLQNSDQHAADRAKNCKNNSDKDKQGSRPSRMLHWLEKMLCRVKGNNVK